MRAPHRIQVGTSYDDSMSLVNDNFEKLARSVNDMGAALSTTTGFTTGSISAGATFRQRVYILNYGQTNSDPFINIAGTANGLLAAVPMVDVYVDSRVSTKLFPTGSTLTTGELALHVSAYISNTTSAGIGEMIITGYNADSVAHTYLIDARIAYFPDRTDD